MSKQKGGSEVGASSRGLPGQALNEGPLDQGVLLDGSKSCIYAARRRAVLSSTPTAPEIHEAALGSLG